MRVLEISYNQEHGLDGITHIAKAYSDGWQLMKPLKYFKCCEMYSITFFLPENNKGLNSNRIS